MSEQGIYLEITKGDNKGTCYRLKEETALIGRSAECDIRLEGVRGVSRTHCRIFVTDQGLRLQDLESQNGTIVQGKRIRDAIVAVGISFKIGEVEFTVRNVAALPALQGGDALELGTAGGTALATAAGGAIGPAAAYDGGGVERASEAMELAAGKSRALLLQLLVLVGLVVAGLYAMQMFAMRSSGYQPFTIVRSFQKKLVNFGCDFDGWDIKNSSEMGKNVIKMQDYRGLLSATLSQLYTENKNIPRRRMMLVIGQANGDAWVTLKRGNRRIRRFLIVCRGYDPYHIPDTLPTDEARALASRSINEAKVFEADGKEYQAWKHYKRAAEYLNISTTDFNAESSAQNEALRLEEKLREKLAGFFIRAIGEAFPAELAVRKADYSEALLLLDRAKLLVPDEESADRQFIDNWYEEIMLQQLRSKRRSKRAD